MEIHYNQLNKVENSEFSIVSYEFLDKVISGTLKQESFKESSSENKY